MFDINFTDLEYEEYLGLGDTGQPNYAPIVTIKGMRVKGQIKVTHSQDGDSTSCSIAYRTNIEIAPQSRINDREVMECVPVSSFGLDKAYISYVK